MGTISIPPYLKKGDTIAFVAPARSISKEQIQAAANLFESWGLKTVNAPNLFGSYHQFSGTEEERAADLQWAINNPNVAAIMCARGGYGSSRMVDLVDWSKLKQNPKWLLGFSDMTVLHGTIHKLGLASIHSSMPSLFHVNEGTPALETIRQCLFGKELIYEWQSKHPVIEGTVQGQLIGGNLSIVNHILETPSDYDYQGKILFIEDLDEYLYHIDRLLMQLERAGVFSKIKALLVGGMTSMHDHDTPFGWSAEQLILHRAEKYSLPVAFDFPAGHINDNRALKFGVEVELVTSYKNSRLTYL